MTLSKLTTESGRGGQLHFKYDLAFINESGESITGCRIYTLAKSKDGTKTLACSQSFSDARAGAGKRVRIGKVSGMFTSLPAAYRDDVLIEAHVQLLDRQMGEPADCEIPSPGKHDSVAVQCPDTIADGEFAELAFVRSRKSSKGADTVRISGAVMSMDTEPRFLVVHAASRRPRMKRPTTEITTSVLLPPHGADDFETSLLLKETGTADGEYLIDVALGVDIPIGEPVRFRDPKSAREHKASLRFYCQSLDARDRLEEFIWEHFEDVVAKVSPWDPDPEETGSWGIFVDQKPTSFDADLKDLEADVLEIFEEDGITSYFDND